MKRIRATSTTFVVIAGAAVLFGLSASAQVDIHPAALLTVTSEPAEGEAPLDVTLFYQLQNIGDVPLVNPVIADACGPVNFLGGDDNANGLLDPFETWLGQATCTINETTTFNPFATAVVCLDPACTQTVGTITGDPDCVPAEFLICDGIMSATVTVTVGLGCTCTESAMIPYDFLAGGGKQLRGIEVNGGLTRDERAYNLTVTVKWNKVVTCSDGAGQCRAQFRLGKSSKWTADDREAAFGEGYIGDPTDPNAPTNITCDSACGQTKFNKVTSIYTARIEEPSGTKITKGIEGVVTLTMMKPGVCAKETGWTMILHIDGKLGGPPGLVSSSSDFDGDGFTNQQEQNRRRPSDPLDPNSTPR